MILLCIKIFLARIIDVSLGTIKTVYSVKGRTWISAFISFIEILIWFFVAKEALTSVSNSVWIPLSYSLGYATGTLIGTYLSKGLISGNLCVNVITKKDAKRLIDIIRCEGYGLSVIDLDSEYESVQKKLLLIEINKKSLKHLLSLINREDDKAFLMLNETSLVIGGVVK